jgi:hypothetical protein
MPLFNLPPPMLGPANLCLSAHDGENMGALSPLPSVASHANSGWSTMSGRGKEVPWR